MKKYEVSKEFILEAHKEACCEWKSKIEEEVPDLFKNRLEVGKWYRDTVENSLLCITKIDDVFVNGYGWDGRKEYDNTFQSLLVQLGYRLSNFKEATKEEVETALIKEWEKNNKPFEHYSYHKPKCITGQNNMLYGWNGDENTTALFNNGKWAEIIEEAPQEITIAELEKELGRKIKIVK